MGSTPVQLAPGDRRSRERLNLGERLTQLVSESARARHRDLRDRRTRRDAPRRFEGRVRGRSAGAGRGTRGERARGESAALWRTQRRLIDANPALMNLRLLQAIAQGAGAPGTTRFVVNLPESIVPAAANRAADDSSPDAQ